MNGDARDRCHMGARIEHELRALLPGDGGAAREHRQQTE